MIRGFIIGIAMLFSPQIFADGPHVCFMTMGSPEEKLAMVRQFLAEPSVVVTPDVTQLRLEIDCALNQRTSGCPARAARNDTVLRMNQLSQRACQITGNCSELVDPSKTNWVGRGGERSQRWLSDACSRPPGQECNSLVISGHFTGFEYWGNNDGTTNFPMMDLTSLIQMSCSGNCRGLFGNLLHVMSFSCNTMAERQDEMNCAALRDVPEGAPLSRQRFCSAFDGLNPLHDTYQGYWRALTPALYTGFTASAPIGRRAVDGVINMTDRTNYRNFLTQLDDAANERVAIQLETISDIFKGHMNDAFKDIIKDGGEIENCFGYPRGDTGSIQNTVCALAGRPVTPQTMETDVTRAVNVLNDLYPGGNDKCPEDSYPPGPTGQQECWRFYMQHATTFFSRLDYDTPNACSLVQQASHGEFYASSASERGAFESRLRGHMQTARQEGSPMIQAQALYMEHLFGFRDRASYVQEIKRAFPGLERGTVSGNEQVVLCHLMNNNSMRLRESDFDASLYSTSAGQQLRGCIQALNARQSTGCLAGTN